MMLASPTYIHNEALFCLITLFKYSIAILKVNDVARRWKSN